jgi:hypothetical protein
MVCEVQVVLAQGFVDPVGHADERWAVDVVADTCLKIPVFTGETQIFQLLCLMMSSGATT